MVVQEAFTPVQCPVNATTPLFVNAGILAGFYCTTAGSIQVTDTANNVIIATHAVSVGWNNIPLALGTGCKLVTSGGCIGTAFVGQ